MNRIIIILIFLVSIGTIFSEDVLRYRSLTLDTFDNPNQSIGWEVRGSKNIAEDYPRVSFINTWPAALHGYNSDRERDLRALGVEAAFTQRGYNYLEIFPTERLADGSFINRSIELPGDTIGLSVWAWGSNYDFSLEVHIRDYRGVVHQVPFGKINYYGWRQLTATIPTAVPRRSPYQFNFADLYVDKIVLWTEPQEPVSGFFLYLDDLQVLSRTNTEVVDGGELFIPEIRDSRWEESSNGTEETN